MYAFVIFFGSRWNGQACRRITMLGNVRHRVGILRSRCPNYRLTSVAAIAIAVIITLVALAISRAAIPVVTMSTARLLPVLVHDCWMSSGERIGYRRTYAILIIFGAFTTMRYSVLPISRAFTSRRHSILPIIGAVRAKGCFILPIIGAATAKGCSTISFFGAVTTKRFCVFVVLGIIMSREYSPFLIVSNGRKCLLISGISRASCTVALLHDIIFIFAEKPQCPERTQLISIKACSWHRCRRRGANSNTFFERKIIRSAFFLIAERQKRCIGHIIGDKFADTHKTKNISGILGSGSFRF